MDKVIERLEGLAYDMEMVSREQMEDGATVMGYAMEGMAARLTACIEDIKSANVWRDEERREKA